MSQELLYIELNQTTATSQNDDLGSFTVNLDRPITLNNGDQLGLYKSFIDTTLEAGQKITLENDIQLNLSFILYTRNWWANTDFKANMNNDGVFLAPDGESQIVDNEDYFVCVNEGNPAANAAIMIDFQYGTLPEVLKQAGGITCNFEYEDVSGNLQRINYKLPIFNKRKELMGLKNLSVKCVNGSFKDVTPVSTLEAGNLFLDPNNHGAGVRRAFFDYDKTPVPPTDFHLTPFIQTVNVKVPKGSYDPATLSELITTELTRIDDTTFVNVPQSSKFLTSGDLLGMSNGIVSGVNDGAFRNSDSCCVDSTTGRKIFLPVSGGRAGTLNPGSKLLYLIGASQVALTFQDNSIFTWEFLHTPYYVGAPGTTKQIGIEYVALTTAGTYGVVNKYGGIAWTDLSANIINADGTIGDAFDFWEDILKFDVGNLCVQFEDVPTFTFDDTDTNTTATTGTSTKLKVPFKDGVNTTGGFVSIDETVDKSSDEVFAYTLFTDELTIPTIISNTFGIQAIQPFDVDSALPFPYFRLDIECSAMNKIIGEKLLLKNTFGVIGRYYEQGTFNSGTSADGIPYLHRGEPIVLSSFKVRILQSDGSVPTLLGDQNTVFLQVVKNIK